MSDAPGGPAGLVEPVDPRLARLLRSAVLDHAVSERRRVHPPRLHVGIPGRPHPVLPLDEAADHALRTDMVAALRQRAGAGALVWLVRQGELSLQDLDAGWLASAAQAYAEAGDELVFVVVNRHGWRDPRSGATRSWRRLRTR